MQIPITVIIPILKNYNNYLEEALKSIQCQSFVPNEILIIGNKNYNLNIKKIIKKYPNCFFYSCKNKTASSRRYYGSLKANNDYLAFMDYDDLWPKNRLEYLFKNINKFSVVYGRLMNFYKINKVIYKIKKKHSVFLFTTSLLSKNFLLRYSKKIFNSKIFLAEYVLHNKFLLNNKFLKINNIVLHRRIHKNNFTANFKTRKLMIKSLRFIIRNRY